MVALALERLRYPLRHLQVSASRLALVGLAVVRFQPVRVWRVRTVQTHGSALRRSRLQCLALRLVKAHRRVA